MLINGTLVNVHALSPIKIHLNKAIGLHQLTVHQDEVRRLTSFNTYVIARKLERSLILTLWLSKIF